MRNRQKASLVVSALIAGVVIAGCGGPEAVPPGQDSSTAIEQANGPNPGDPMSNSPSDGGSGGPAGPGGGSQ